MVTHSCPSRAESPAAATLAASENGLYVSFALKDGRVVWSARPIPRVGLRPTAKAEDMPPGPTVGAPAPYPNREFRMKYQLVAWAIIPIAIALGGCTKRTPHDVFDLACGPGRLVLHEEYTQTFETSYVAFELRYIEGKTVRLVDTLKPRTSIYVGPTLDERFRSLRDGAEDPYPIFVNPAQFSPAEYVQIYQTLASNLATIDEAVARPRAPVEYFGEDRQPWLSSIRYTDYDGFRRVYQSPARHTDITVQPDGQVWLRRSEGRRFGEGRTLIGIVRGNQALLLPYNSRRAGGMSGENVYTQENVQRWKSARQRTIFDDFDVRIAQTEKEVDAALFKKP